VETGPGIHDARPVSTALQSEERAFESLYRLNRSPVYAYALLRVRHAADAEDITQTTFMKAYCALHRGAAPRDDLQWLLAIARNVCHDRFREAKRRPKEEPLGDWIRLEQPDAPEFAIKDVVRKLASLDPRHRQILVMREFEGRSYAEISSQLGVSEAAVQTLLVRARRALRDELELGITCSHARRVALRNMNGVALLEERRALKRHLRRCPECATFVGRSPRTPVAKFVWVVTMPYRKLWSIMVGTSAVPVGSTAGGTAGVAAKLITMTMVGSAAVGVTGVTVKEIASERTIHPAPGPALTRPAASPRHSTPSPQLTFSSWTAGGATTSGAVVAAHDAKASPPPPIPDQVAGRAASVAVQSSSSPSAASAPVSSPTAEAAAAATQPAGDQPAPAPDPAASTAVPSGEAPTPAASSDPSAGVGSDAAAADDATAAPVTPVATLPASDTGQSPAATAPPPPSDPGQSNGNHNGVGQDGTPPGQAKADAPHGKP